MDLYDVFCAVMYIVKGGIQWRMLPSDFPDWRLVYYYFTVWSKKNENGVSILDTVLKKLVRMIRNDALKKDSPILGILDSKSIKNADTAQEKGYDAGKKVSGIKLHIITDTMGLPHAISISCADINDRTGGINTIACNLSSLLCMEKIIVDGGYTGENFAVSVRDLCGAEVEVVKRSGMHKFEVLPKRWIVERSFTRVDKYRRLWKNCEKNYILLFKWLLLFLFFCSSEDFRQVIGFRSNYCRSDSYHCSVTEKEILIFI